MVAVKVADAPRQMVGEFTATVGSGLTVTAAGVLIVPPTLLITVTV